MFLKLKSAAVMGLNCLPVEVEVDIHKGQSLFNIVGLADTAIRESRDRIYSAIKNSGFTYPFNFRILVNLAPANLQKEGPSYDLPMAVGIILISNEKPIPLENCLLVGELALDGSLRRIDGVLPLALHAQTEGLTEIFVPADNAGEAALVNGLTIYPVKNLKQIIDHFIGQIKIEPFTGSSLAAEFTHIETGLDMSFVKGQEFAKRALEIAASGGHNILMSGPPGSGKTLLARTLPSILPKLTTDEALEITKIYSVAGLLRGNFIKTRPFRSPHHTISNVALVGGGKYPRPGEISLSHRGVLFLDEFPEFPRAVIEAMRQPLEDGVITVSRAQGSLTFPARFILVASQNPCACGYYGDLEKQCTCHPVQLMRYRKKISGPILDRIDLHIEVPRVDFKKLTSDTAGETSADIRNRVEQARAIQQKRFAGLPMHINSEMGNAQIKNFCRLNDESLELLRRAVSVLRLSARGYNRVLKLARTVADLNNSEDILTAHLAEALQYRDKSER